MQKKIIFLRLLLILLLFLFSFSASASDFGKYNNTNQLIWDNNFRSFVKNYFVKIKYKMEPYDMLGNNLLADYIIETLSGAADHIIHLEKNVIFAGACMAYECSTKGAVVLDINTNEALFGVIDSFSIHESIVPDDNIEKITLTQGDIKNKITLLIAYKDDDFKNKYLYLFLNWVKEMDIIIDEVTYIKIKKNAKVPLVDVIEMQKEKIFKTFYGKWKVVEFREYNKEHAFITKQAVKNNIGKEIELNTDNVVLEENFLFRWSTSCENPVAYFLSRRGFIKGDSIETSRDFGFMPRREYINIIDLVCNDAPYTTFELIGNNKLLVLWDGYFVIMKKFHRH